MEASVPYIYYTLLIYHMMHKKGSLTLIWHDAELFFQQYECEAIFDQNAAPTTWDEILRCFRRIPHASKNQNFLQPSRLMEFVYMDSKMQSTASAAQLWAYIENHTQTGEKSQMAEKLSVRKAMTTSEQFKWHFNYLSFQIDFCDPITELTATSLFEYFVDTDN
ncbi:hypothetical protein BU25DRAFT_424029 [Macroventuria anomochaeta]|uniref:Uncharacterized protein n=1 Tax=Macroventuria anomochaeta TaxID=301207 RepID=A0ACB6RRH2_9PLEO|nr:uncharacterized protein BU25DRAFT_424029 [Macroventuria anomochaeta]KAF2624575.1 hypothetical protein BU25DRAFT_424029 [Macroventuria anomochaeta]